MSRAMLTFAAALALAGLAAAAEHPEHPTGPTSEKAETMKAPQEPPTGSKAWLKWMRKGYTKAVETRVKDDVKAGGFKVHDDKLGKDWDLKLDHVHKDRIVFLGGTSFFACADFKSAQKGQKDKVDLDFYATKKGDAWTIDKVLVHKVNGKARYTYNAKNEMVPVAQ